MSGNMGSVSASAGSLSCEKSCASRKAVRREMLGANGTGGSGKLFVDDLLCSDPLELRLRRPALARRRRTDWILVALAAPTRKVFLAATMRWRNLYFLPLLSVLMIGPSRTSKTTSEGLSGTLQSYPSLGGPSGSNSSSCQADVQP